MKLLPVCLGKVSSVVLITASGTVIGLACKGPTEPPPPPIVAAVSVTPASATLVSLGETTTLSAAAANSTGGVITGKTFTWSSSNTSVATVNASGTVTAVFNGTATITATVDGVNGTASILVQQAATTIAVNDGDGQSAGSGTAVATPPSVNVTDARGNGVQGISVTFAVASGSGTVVPTTPVTTNSSGIAAVTSWTLGTAVGTNTLTATSSGLTGSPLTFTATSALGAPASITILAGDGQTATAGSAVAVAPSVSVEDQNGNPIPGETVSFTVQSGGGTIDPATIATDANGVATVNSWTLGTTAGANTMDATAGGVTTTFSATGVAGAAAAMAISAGDNQSANLNTFVATPPAVIVTDANANPASGVDVTFTVASGGGTVDPVTAVTTDANGIAAVKSWTLGGTAGANTLDASATGLTTVTFNATAVVPAATNSIAINNGDGQTIVTGATAIIPPSALVLDLGGLLVVGVTVDFAVTTGAGTISGGASTSAVTDASGVATADTWVFDATAGTNVITATVTGVGSVMFTGTGVAAGGYDIDVRMLTTPTMAQQTAFDNAEARWENLVVSELSDGLAMTAADLCGITHPALDETVDDLLILVRLEAIDGPGGVLGSAGPCLVRTGTVLTAVGVMRFDIADLADLEAAGQLEDVILHEMAHVIGIGTFWDAAGFLQNPSLDVDGNPIAGQDTHFNGNHAVVAFEDRLGGSSYTGGASVPVENEFGGQGTRDAHWRESVFVAELLTGFLDLGVANPLSLLTIASLADHGYAVNPDGADIYNQVFTVRGVSDGKISLGDDIWRGPLYTISPTGVITRVR